MGIELLEGKRTDHQPIDDIEAVFWVLVYAVLRHCQHQNPHFLNGNTLFDQSHNHISPDSQVFSLGGEAKRNWLSSIRVVSVPFDCPPLNELITDLSSQWGLYDARRQIAKLSAGASDQLTYQEWRTDLANPDWSIQKLENALAQPGWLPDDFVVDQFTRRTTHQAHLMVDVAVALTNDTRKKPEDKVINPGTISRLRRKTSRARLDSSKPRKRTLSQTSTPAVNPRAAKKKRGGHKPKQ